MAAKYQLLADKLRDELARNSGRPGYKLPTEQDLSRQYHLSRQTVRHALSLLEEEGLIQRRQGSGSYATGLLPGAAPRQIAVVTFFLDDYIFPAILHDASDDVLRPAAQVHHRLGHGAAQPDAVADQQRDQYGEQEQHQQNFRRHEAAGHHRHAAHPALDGIRAAYERFPPQ